MLAAREVKNIDELTLLNMARRWSTVYQDIYEALKPGVRESEIVARHGAPVRDGLGLRRGDQLDPGERCSPHPHNFTDRLIRPGDRRSSTSSSRSWATARATTARSTSGARRPAAHRVPQGARVDGQGDRRAEAGRVERRRRALPKAQDIGFPNEMEAFGLNFCHGLGLGLHERPLVSRLTSLKEPIELKAGMVFAVETYCPATDGISAARIEEEVILTPNGAKIISLFPAEELPIANRIDRAMTTSRISGKHRLGWIGTGRMGFPMAQRLPKAGCDIAVWNRTRAKAEPLAAAGEGRRYACRARRPRHRVHDGVDVARPRGVVGGTHGLLSHHGKAPKVLVDCSTVSADASAVVRDAMRRAGGAMLAAPVSGNAKVVKAGRLSIVASGPRTRTRWPSRISPSGEGVSYVGDGELAHREDLPQRAARRREPVAGRDHRARRARGVPRHAFLDFINKSVMGSTFTRYKTPGIVKLDFTTTFTPVLLRKDLDLGPPPRASSACRCRSPRRRASSCRR